MLRFKMICCGMDQNTVLLSRVNAGQVLHQSGGRDRYVEIFALSPGKPQTLLLLDWIGLLTLSYKTPLSFCPK